MFLVFTYYRPVLSMWGVVLVHYPGLHVRHGGRLASVDPCWLYNGCTAPLQDAYEEEEEQNNLVEAVDCKEEPGGRGDHD